jgi:asparagine synthase (glutamine-hydrolysing)
LENVIYQIESYDPNTIRASIPMYLLSKYLKENTDYKVFLSGEGADELFCGYNYFNQAINDIDIENETKRLIKNIHMFDVLRADRCFNSQGLEIRVPFLDKDFVRFSLGINGFLRGFINKTEKYLLRDTFKDKYPILSTSRIIDRQKERMSDGCGFSYVPQLLNYCLTLQNKICNDLTSKEIYEKEYYKNIFDNYYKYDNVIIKRELPKWSIQNDKNANLLVI